MFLFLKELYLASVIISLLIFTLLILRQLFRKDYEHFAQLIIILPVIIGMSLLPGINIYCVYECMKGE